MLDLFAGSGALGIESLSRGAAEAFFVERDRRSAGMIEENLKRCRLTEKGTVLCRTAEAALGQVTGPFDLVFMDPPFPMVKGWRETGTGERLAEGIPPLLHAEGHLVFRYETEKGQALPAWPGLKCIWERQYGRSQVCIYTHACTRA